jgi:hypothetical protein
VRERQNPDQVPRDASDRGTSLKKIIIGGVDSRQRPWLNVQFCNLPRLRRLAEIAFLQG